MERYLTTLLRVLGLLWWEQRKGPRYQRSYHPRTARRASGGVLAAARGRFSPPAPPLCLAALFSAAPRAFATRLFGSFVCLGWPPSSAFCGLRFAAVGGLRRPLTPSALGARIPRPHRFGLIVALGARTPRPNRSSLVGSGSPPWAAHVAR